MSKCFREAYVHFPAKLPIRAMLTCRFIMVLQFGQMATRLPNFSVMGHSPPCCPRRSWSAATHAIEFPRLTSPFVFYATGMKKCHQNMAKNQHRAFVVDGSKPFFLNPVANCILVNIEKLGDLFHCIAAVNLY